MSKTFSLAGIRIGWIASRSFDAVETCASVRHYTTISVSQVDDQIAAFATQPKTSQSLLTRNLDLARSNLGILEAFIEQYSWACEWAKPKGGTTALVKFKTRQGTPINDVVFCQRLQEKTGVMFVPASRCFGDGVDFRGYVRIGYVPEHDVIVDGLKAVRSFMETDYDSLPVSEKVQEN
jgi:aspartate/methionine/tyrosine aminotransferase